ncbi:NAD(P)/FAD-dependent oxidoreductase [Caproicibacterium argilliputei]|uniref:FAD-dependent protein C-terminal domain-containing protein n=1 Tax=Caproicibacterium argilliputei TaxID=3030016 RepID=A0AA97DA55_9FIRM|nr:hypothetical protein [Caproicibacterium argilliputei]WOC33425.1 hypothetical protein PXC00_06045 [Caproicibacterium argilliputei]
MIYQISEISLGLHSPETELTARAAKRLHLREADIASCKLSRRSIDARKKENVHFTCTVEVTLRPGIQVRRHVLERDRKIRAAAIYRYQLPQSVLLPVRPVVAGFGPAGLFAALTLAQAGQRPIVLERGAPVEERQRDVQHFWQSGVLDPASNVQFGEGGAGTFSDGKLTTGTKDSRIRHVLESFVQAGAPACILWEAKPHIGTDKLPNVVKTLRETILSLGGEIHFHSTLQNLALKNGRLHAVTVRESDGGQYQLPCQNLILAVGHSARDTFPMLLENQLTLQQKPFAVGVRIEHLQQEMDRAQYGTAAGDPALGASSYKLAAHLENGRGVYTFCMCPGGTVVAAASEENRLVTNGMSVFARDGANANAALLVGLSPADFGSTDPLAGIALQRALESSAYREGGGAYLAPVQRLGDFLDGRASTGCGRVRSTYSRGVRYTDLHRCLPRFMTDALEQGSRLMAHRLRGFDDPDALLTAVESRSSSPVRIVRTQELTAPGAEGLYPCGEGAGYAGGIVSAAVDGIRCAEAILMKSFEKA